MISVGVQIWRYNLILARRTPCMGWGLTPPTSIYTNIKVRWLWMAMNNPYPLAFSKLVLNVKVKFLLISWHFLVVFWLCTPHLPIHWNPYFGFIKGIQLVHIYAKFHLCLICSSPVLKFQMFSAEGTILGCFWLVFWT